MIQIRKDQMDAFSKVRYQDFERRMTQHLRKFFPDKMRQMAEDEVKAFIRRCMEKAKRYDLVSEQSVAYFSHLPMLLGEDFERSRRYRFAIAVLRAPAGAPEERVKVAMLLAHQLKL